MVLKQSIKSGKNLLMCKYFRHCCICRVSECSRQTPPPHDWHCSVDWGYLSFSSFVLHMALAWWILHRNSFPLHSYLFSVFSFGLGSTNAVLRNNLLFIWSIGLWLFNDYLCFYKQHAALQVIWLNCIQSQDCLTSSHVRTLYCFSLTRVTSSI